MLNILIQETDLFFQAGLQSFFDDFFKHNFHRSITFHLALTNENVSQADIIVLSLCQGETLTCFPEFIFLARRAALDRISGVLFIAWFRTQLPGYTLNKKTCFDCQHKGLSRQQIRIMVNFYRGLSVVQTANALKMSEKTVFTHKY